MSGLISSHFIESTQQWNAQHPSASNNTPINNSALVPGILPPSNSQPQLNWDGANVTGLFAPAPQGTQPLAQIAQAAQTAPQSTMTYNPNAMNGMNFNNYGQAGGPMGVNWMNPSNNYSLSNLAQIITPPASTAVPMVNNPGGAA